MLYRLLARSLATLHVAYVVFVVAGSLFVLRWPSLRWLHAAAIVWAVLTMTTNLGCWLTNWEKDFLRKGGIEPYPEGFLQHHVLRTVLPPDQSRRVHIALGIAVLIGNGVVYALLSRR